MISGGAAFTFTILGILAGFAIGYAGRHSTTRDNEALPPRDDLQTFRRIRREHGLRAAADWAATGHEPPPTDQGSNRGDIEDAVEAVGRKCMETYRAMHADPAVKRALAWPRLMIVDDRVPVGEVRLLDGDEVRQMCGVDAETILRALGRR